MSAQTPDLIARLRFKFPTVQEAMANSREAADEIERRRAENERLRRAVVLNARFDTPLGGVS